MKFLKIYFAILFIPVTINLFASNNDGDTIRLKPKEKEVIPYPQQPAIIKTNPFAILWGPIFYTAEYKLLLEMPTSRRQSFQVGLSYLGKSPVISLLERNMHPSQRMTITGFRIQIAQRFYIVRKKYGSPFGFYFSPTASFSSANITIGKSSANRKNESLNVTHFNTTLLIGVQVGRGKKITADVFGGVGYKRNTWIYQPSYYYRSIPPNIKDMGEFYNSSLKLTLGFSIGYALY